MTEDKAKLERVRAMKPIDRVRAMREILTKQPTAFPRVVSGVSADADRREAILLQDIADNLLSMRCIEPLLDVMGPECRREWVIESIARWSFHGRRAGGGLITPDTEL